MSATAHPNVSGYATWVDPYATSPRDSLGDHQPMAPLGLETLDASWDPAVELQQLLLQPPDGHEFCSASSGYGRTSESLKDSALVGLSGATAELPHVRPASPGHRRRAPARSPSFTLVQTASFSIAALTVVIVSMVSVFGGMVALDPLRDFAESRTSQGLIGWWPLLVYGPWMVASLCILHASLHQRRTVHSWSVVLFFSTVATWLCVTQAPRTLTDAATAALPPLAALACFQQLVRLITLVRPPRQSTPRHRTRVSSFAGRRASAARVGKAPRTSLRESDRTAPHKQESSRTAFPRQHSPQRGWFL
ncbi:DUF2637 domain-containing protein [Streptomyces sp. NPDC002889]|uniref:DUF2637 domain-containing protein n=1 Tax=Streptomyces sp. NPDC002889 TaxID=3364669 RepID=UPI0036A1FB14